MSSSYGIRGHNIFEYNPPYASSPSLYECEDDDEDIDAQIDPNLCNYTCNYTLPSGDLDGGLPITATPQLEQLYYFVCGCCGRPSPKFNDKMITFNRDELEQREDLLLCWECRINCFPGLEKWRFKDIFHRSPGSTLPFDSMIRVLSPRSFHGGKRADWQTREIRPHEHRKHRTAFRRKLIPGIPYIWPLWSVKIGPKKKAGKSTLNQANVSTGGSLGKSLEKPNEESLHTKIPTSKNATEPKIKPYKCVLCLAAFAKPSDFVDHISRYMGRYKSTRCTEEELRDNPPPKSKRLLPSNVFARYEEAKAHFLNTTTFAKYHGDVTADDIQNFIEHDSQDDMLEIGLTEWRNHGKSEIIPAEAIAIGVDEEPIAKPPSFRHTTWQTASQPWNQLPVY
ncbi:hypothetical protein AOL_s00007g102 [Orbilia oligospora ATCC 24927]|uniref:C2H2-type domain-containing protein n=2 Tax=Orbilia oligospora TaxID=2813651 RepID=G1X1E3_ARTOA|nr:hypothetical protein AOL_s00007g102 [Orbilia oligospora ATCC 24927]EGX52766.1 hypothetical protein AOL_s00007g102 [Orbilia oligospora ATCC 24927]KAF3287566.1 hypothetical protein TWF970_007284 [Orbilia oligospora]